MRLSRQAGWSYFEFAVAAAVLGLLLAVFLSKIAFYEAVAEDIAVTRTRTALQEALMLEVNACKRGGRPLAALAHENPLDWLDHRPPNELGEQDAAAWKEAPRGNWFYDRRDGSLIYIWNSDRNRDKNQSPLLRFRVEMLYGAGGASRAPRQPVGAVLVQVSTFDLPTT